MISLTPDNWIDYELIDSGDFEKLERFGQFILIRPEPQAVWPKSISEREWVSKAHAKFTMFKGKENDEVKKVSERGEWDVLNRIPQKWSIGYKYMDMNLRFNLSITSFKHIGLFPEQAVNWQYIYDKLTNISKPKVLNLFAYTGGASLAARAAGAEVYHVDSVKSVLDWANSNMQISKQDTIHWICEDAFKFVERELRREKIYDAIILDPPAYGRGPKGEKWLIETMLGPLVENCSRLLDRNNGCILLNMYSIGFSSLISENLLKSYFTGFKNLETGELYFSDQAGRKLPLGVFTRLSYK